MLSSKSRVVVVPRGSSCRGGGRKGATTTTTTTTTWSKWRGSRSSGEGASYKVQWPCRGRAYGDSGGEMGGGGVKRKSQLESGELKGWLCAGK